MRPLSQKNRWLVVVLVVWLASICTHAWLYVRSVLAHPEQVTEWYARSISFQLVAFVYVNLIYWLAALAIALLIVQIGAGRTRPRV